MPTPLRTRLALSRLLAYLTLLVLGFFVIPQAHASATYLLAYPAAPYDTPSATYTLKADKTNIPLTSFYGGRYSFGHLAFQGTATFVLTVKCGQAITGYNISPHAFGVTGKVNVSTSSGPLEPMVLAGDPKETGAPTIGRSVYDITAPPYNADRTGKTLLNGTIQTALNEVSAKGGGTLYFPAGVYKISNNIKMTSNITLYLAPGAFLRGSSNRDDYTWNTGGRLRNGQPAQGPQNFVIPGGVNNVAFTGRGVIDANSTVLATAANPGGTVDGFGNYRKGIIHSGIENGGSQPNGIKLIGITVKDATTWTLNIEDSLNVTIQNVKMVNDFKWIHSDGYDLVSTSNGTVDNCLGVTGDDVYNAKANASNPITNIVYSNNVGYSFKGTGTKIGVQSAGVARNIVFTHIQVVAGQRAVSVSHDSGTAAWSDLHFSDIHMENIEGTSTTGQFLVAPIIIWTLGGGAGPVSNVSLSHVTVDNSGGFRSQIVGTSANVGISNVSLQDVSIDGVTLTSSNYTSKLTVGPNVTGVHFGPVSGGVHTAGVRK
jgi:polygalacturonase